VEAAAAVAPPTVDIKSPFVSRRCEALLALTLNFTRTLILTLILTLSLTLTLTLKPN
jgi:hypothetical protein